MKRWVKFADGKITEGPIGADEQPEGFIEYDEVLDLPPGHGTVSVSLELVDGKCIKTVTATPVYYVQRQASYPSIGDQLDMFWHAMDEGVLQKVEPFYSDVANIKNQYPKPTA
jgi:hypothetical protein